MKRNIKIPIALFILLIGYMQQYSFAQVNKLMEAYECYQNRNMTCAKNKIDSVVVHPETKDEPGAWSIRGYVYYQYFKNYEYNLYNSNYRNESIKSIKKSMELGPDVEMQQQNKQLLKALAESYYNQIKIYLYDSLNYDRCVDLYNNYKKMYQELEPSNNFRDKDIEFNLSVGGQFVSTVKQLLESGSEFSDNIFNQYTEMAKISFNKVLELDANNTAALKGLAIAYYNQGAKLIKEMSFDTPIEQIEQIQENANKYFKQSLPYMLKAYENKPNDDKIIEGLAGIYYALHENEKFIEFNKKLEKLKNQK